MCVDRVVATKSAAECDERDSFAAEAAQITWGRTLRFIDSHM
jgi:hypothetical protein